MCVCVCMYIYIYIYIYICNVYISYISLSRSLPSLEEVDVGVEGKRAVGAELALDVRPRLQEDLRRVKICTYIYIYIYIHTYTYIYTYIYIYIYDIDTEIRLKIQHQHV